MAGLTGLPLDALVQREAARRQRRSAVLASVSLLLAGVMAVLTLFAVQGRREADRQRAQADGLVEYMLTDLRKKLEPVGRLEVLDSVGQRALAYYEAQNIGALDPDELSRRARALHLVGEVRDLRGDSEGALKAFREAERTTGEQLAREPDNPERMFDHAQSLFWVGQTAWAREDWPVAEAKFSAYAELVDRTAATDPANRTWRREQGYAANSLGALYLRVNRADEAIPQFRLYLQVEKELARQAPADMNLQKQAGQAHAWLADALLASGRLAEARAERQAELQAYSDVLAGDDRDFEVRMFMARAEEAYCDIHLLEGDIEPAMARCRIAVESFRPLLAEDPQNRLVQEMMANALNRHSEALLLGGQYRLAEAQNRAALAGANELASADPARTGWRSILMRARVMAVEADFARQRPVAAREGMERFQTDFGPLRAEDIASGREGIWVIIHALTAVERLAANDAAAARSEAAKANAAAGEHADAREAAFLEALSARVPGFAPKPRWPASAYPADRRLAAAGRG